jgi:hypothetical protein
MFVAALISLILKFVTARYLGDIGILLTGAMVSLLIIWPAFTWLANASIAEIGEAPK